MTTEDDKPRLLDPYAPNQGEDPDVVGEEDLDPDDYAWVDRLVAEGHLRYEYDDQPAPEPG